MPERMTFSQWKKSDYTYVNSFSIKPPKLIRYLNIYSKLHSKRGARKSLITEVTQMTIADQATTRNHDF